VTVGLDTQEEPSCTDFLSGRAQSLQQVEAALLVACGQKEALYLPGIGAAATPKTDQALNEHMANINEATLFVP